MPFLQIEDQRIPLLEGETRVGKGESADVPLPGPEGARTVGGNGADGDEEGGEGIWAIITVGSGRKAAIRRASPGAQVDVNGLAVGMRPSPLIHGDRLSIAGTVAVFGDESHTGSTVEISSLLLNDDPGARAAAAPQARVNGRVVSLVDGREYTVRSDGLTIGREPGCDIVIAAGEVSRRHARIELKTDGYVIVDISTNGVLVNDIRVERSRPLARGDRIRIGSEELRFHADLEELEPPPPPPIILPPRPVTESVPLLNTAASARRGGLRVSAALAAAQTEESRAADQGRVPRFLVLAVIGLALAVVYLFVQTV